MEMIDQEAFEASIFKTLDTFHPLSTNNIERGLLKISNVVVKYVCTMILSSLAGMNPKETRLFFREDVICCRASFLSSQNSVLI